MFANDKAAICLLIIVITFISCNGQNFWKIHDVATVSPDTSVHITWCTISRAEQQKCHNFAMANERDRIRVGYKHATIECKQAENKDVCMQLLDEEKATMTTLDAGSIFVGGRYHSLVPIAQEVLEGEQNFYYSVAVVKKGTLDDVVSLSGLRGKKACFPGVEAFAGWIVPIYTLMKEGGMEIVDCNNHVKSASNFFGPSCSVNVLADKFNPIGDNSDKLCRLCIGKIPGGRCTDTDPYAGYEGAFRCLLEAGEVAFLKHTTVNELVSALEYAALSVDSFELLCKDGTRRPVSDYLACNWGQAPSDAVVVSSAVSFEKRVLYQHFLAKFAEIYPKNGTSTNNRNNKYGANQPNEYGRQQPEYDQFGNRINRFKRQNFGSPNSQDDVTRFSNNPYTSNNNEYNPYTTNSENNPYGSNQNNNPYSNDNSNRNNNPYSSNSNNPYNSNDNNNNNPYNTNNNNPYSNDNNQNNPYGRDNNRNQGANTAGQNYDPFAKDPYAINRDQYGINIDPYVTDVKYNKNDDPIYTNADDENENTFNSTYRPRDNVTYYERFSLFESTPKYGIHANLMFQDAAKAIVAVPENQQTYANFLGPSLDIVMGIRDCPTSRMVLCVTSDAEKNKCVKMRTALKAQLLKPEMECYKGHSQIHCMQAIRAGTADVAVLDASDVYTAGLNYDLVPFISEVYNLDEPEYYVVAVGKESDPSTELTYLKNKNTCHGGINTAAGWVYPLAFLISNGWIRPYGCNSIRAAAEYFTKSCVPGAISTEYNTGVPYDNMCDLCHGASYRYCRRDASEDYYGHTGAFRCLVEGGGHVAFVKHTTVTENTNGKKREWWARDNLNEDFELLCPDGTRAEINEYTKCNLGKVKANAIVTRGGYGYEETHIKAFINLFLYAQTFYGRKTTDEFSFSMFSSPPPFSDLIFQDATTQLKVIEPNQRNYAAYLGGDFLRARRIVDCHASAGTLFVSVLTLLLPTFLVLM